MSAKKCEVCAGEGLVHDDSQMGMDTYHRGYIFCDKCNGDGGNAEFVNQEDCDHNWESINDMKRFTRITKCVICGKVKEEEE